MEISPWYCFQMYDDYKADNDISKCVPYLAVKLKISVMILSAFLTNFKPSYI